MLDDGDVRRGPPAAPAPADATPVRCVEPEGSETCELADGSAVELDVAEARIEAMGRFGGLNVVFGDDHAVPLLGVIALETLGVEVDPRNECPRLLPAKRAVTPRRVRRRERGG